VVFAGETLPEKIPLSVDKDVDHCLARGPIHSEKWVVNAQNKGVRWVVVFLKPPAGQSLAIHDSLRQPKQKEVVVDQPQCAFEPHVVVLQTGQTLVAKNSSPITHNMVMKGVKNEYNDLIPAGRSLTYPVGEKLVPHYSPVKLSCGAHLWMEGVGWIFDHPYYTVTDAEGKFEIPLAPSGEQNLVIWHESAGYAPDSKGRVIEVKGGEAVTDLGQIAIKPKM
jgi:plastocyanin